MGVRFSNVNDDHECFRVGDLWWSSSKRHRLYPEARKKQIRHIFGKKTWFRRENYTMQQIVWIINIDFGDRFVDGYDFRLLESWTKMRLMDKH